MRNVLERWQSKWETGPLQNPLAEFRELRGHGLAGFNSVSSLATETIRTYQIPGSQDKFGINFYLSQSLDKVRVPCVIQHPTLRSIIRIPAGYDIVIPADRGSNLTPHLPLFLSSLSWRLLRRCLLRHGRPVLIPMLGLRRRRVHRKVLPISPSQPFAPSAKC